MTFQQHQWDVLRPKDAMVEQKGRRVFRAVVQIAEATVQMYSVSALQEESGTAWNAQGIYRRTERSRRSLAAEGSSEEGCVVVVDCAH